jgi:hypothetical protein
MHDLLLYLAGFVSAIVFNIVGSFFYFRSERRAFLKQFPDFPGNGQGGIQ